MSGSRTVAVVTGSRAEYGPLRPVMKAIAGHPALNLRVIVTGSHLLPPAETINDVKADFAIDATVAMQSIGHGQASGPLSGRLSDSASLGRGISGLAEVFSRLSPYVVVVLGDRIEAFAAAAAASVGGIRVAHIHGGDRAEGIADEAMRHAITKLAHIHFPATTTSAMRIVAMGENPSRVHVVGSPAIDGLHDIPPMTDREFQSLGEPKIIMLLHPLGDADDVERSRATQLLRASTGAGSTLVLHPNSDPGRDGIMSVINRSDCQHVAHLRREKFVGLLRRSSVIVGNSSAGLIECAAIPVRCVNVGPRQAGREKPTNVVDVADGDYQTIAAAIEQALLSPLKSIDHPYGDGTAGIRTADVLATFDPTIHSLRKINTY